jgi:hypothetical protein
MTPNLRTSGKRFLRVNSEGHGLLGVVGEHDALHQAGGVRDAYRVHFSPGACVRSGRCCCCCCCCCCRCRPLTHWLALLAAQCVGTVAKVSGTSMQPTLNAAEYPQRVPFFLDHVLINRLAARRYDFQRGDVVTLWSPESQGTVLIKRVVGVAGDWVRVPVSQTVRLPS